MLQCATSSPLFSANDSRHLTVPTFFSRTLRASRLTDARNPARTIVRIRVSNTSEAAVDHLLPLGESTVLYSASLQLVHQGANTESSARRDRSIRCSPRRSGRFLRLVHVPSSPVSRHNVEHQPGGAAGEDVDGRRDGRERLRGQTAQLVHRRRVHDLHRHSRPPPIRHEAHLVRGPVGQLLLYCTPLPSIHNSTCASMTRSIFPQMLGATGVLARLGRICRYACIPNSQ